MIEALLVAFALLSAADVITSAIAFRRGMEEAWFLPALIFRIAPPVPAMIVIKLLFLGFLWWALNLRVTGTWELLRWATVGMMIGGTAFVVVSNIRALRSPG